VQHGHDRLRGQRDAVVIGGDLGVVQLVIWLVKILASVNPESRRF
jgi:hypothetical protein